MMNQELTKVQNTMVYPYCTIGKLLYEEQDQYSHLKGHGTAILIGPNLIMTAAHNVLNLRCRQQFKNYKFYLSGYEQIFDIIKIYYPERLKYVEKQQERKQLDYALLELEQSIGYIYGYMKPKFDFVSNQFQVAIYGYPAIIRKNGKRQRVETQMFGDKGSCRIEQNNLIYGIDTSPGMGGSPIIIQQNGIYYVIGVHTDGSRDKTRRGTLLTPKIKNQFQKWIPGIKLSQPKQVQKLQQCMK